MHQMQQHVVQEESLYAADGGCNEAQQEAQQCLKSGYECLTELLADRQGPGRGAGPLLQAVLHTIATVAEARAPATAGELDRCVP